MVVKHKKMEELPHVLIVDDDDRIRQLVSRFLQDNGFVVSTAPDAKYAKEALARIKFDALVVDIMMPGQNGIQFTEELRSESNEIPILLLTALGDVDDRIKGLESGADDYLAKPFEPRELVLRLQSILKRTTTNSKQLKSFKIGPWTYNVEFNELKNGETTLRLTTVEGNLLNALASKHGVPISRDELAELCNIDSGERTIDVQVTRF
jgi:two-component system phosphate regulon response regulator OmpR